MDLLWLVTEWLGLDFASMSRGRMIAAVVIHSLFDLSLIFGAVLTYIQATSMVWVSVAAAMLLFALFELAGIALNLRALRIKRAGAS